MTFEHVNSRGLVMLGCGKMGSAMLAGCLQGGLDPASVYIIDPHPSDWLRARGVKINADLPPEPAAVIVAVKPQGMDAALPQVTQYAGGATLVISIAAGVTLARFEAAFDRNTPIIRAMPNTAAAVQLSATAIIGNAATTADHMTLAEAILRSIGSVEVLDTEDQIDAVTGVSGSGPAYVFFLIDCLAAAAREQGLPVDLAMTLARQTVAGAGALAQTAGDSPEQLRINVTSPGGTTQAGLEVLMDPESGLEPLIRRTVAAATDRSKALRG